MEKWDGESLAELHAKFLNLNYYQILDISRSASVFEAKEAYFQLAREYHPDLLQRDLSKDNKKMAGEIFDRINKAFQTISNDNRRRKYDAQLDSMSSDKKNLTALAQAKFQKGKALYVQGRYEEALCHLAEAVKLRENSAQYYLMLARTESEISHYRRQAEHDFLKAIQIEPWNPDLYVALGLFYKNEDLKIKAARQFEKALNIDPGHKHALLELGRKSGKPKLNKKFFGNRPSPKVK